MVSCNSNGHSTTGVVERDKDEVIKGVDMLTKKVSDVVRNF